MRQSSWVSYRPGLFKIPRLYIWYPRKLPLSAISRYGVIQGFEIVDLIFFCTEMHYEHFKVLNVLPCFPFLLKNTENIPLIDGEWCTKRVLPRWLRH